MCCQAVLNGLIVLLIHKIVTKSYRPPTVQLSKSYRPPTVPLLPDHRFVILSVAKDLFHRNCHYHEGKILRYAQNDRGSE